MASFFGKVLNFIGLEQAEEDEYLDDEEYGYEEPVYEQPVSAPRPRKAKVVPMPSHQSGGMKMMIYVPNTYEDTQRIIDNVRMNKPVVVNLEDLEIEVAQRVLDFMSGAVYALNGGIHKVTKGIFILAPNNVDITGNTPEDIRSGAFYSVDAQERRGV